MWEEMPKRDFSQAFGWRPAMRAKPGVPTRRYVRRFASRSPDRALDIVVRLLGLPGRTFRARFAGQSPLLCHGDPERFGPIFGKAAPLKMASLRIVVANYQQAIHTVEFDQANRLAPRKTRRRNLHSMMRDAPVGYFLANYQLQFQSVRAAGAELCAGRS